MLETSGISFSSSSQPAQALKRGHTFNLENASQREMNRDSCEIGRHVAWQSQLWWFRRSSRGSLESERPSVGVHFVGRPRTPDTRLPKPCCSVKPVRHISMFGCIGTLPSLALASSLFSLVSSSFGPLCDVSLPIPSRPRGAFTSCLGLVWDGRLVTGLGLHASVARSVYEVCVVARSSSVLMQAILLFVFTSSIPLTYIYKF